MKGWHRRAVLARPLTPPPSVGATQSAGILKCFPVPFGPDAPFGVDAVDATELRESLLTIARTHEWAWSSDTRALLDQCAATPDGVHPIVGIEALDEAALTDLAANDTLVTAIDDAAAKAQALAGQTPGAPDVAYFSPEFGITEDIAQYSGGLGILAGDHLKSASDLGLSFCAVGLYYRSGFFRQEVSRGRQAERIETHDAPALGAIDTGLTVTVPMADRTVAARVWRLQVGRIALLLLDTDLDTNTADDRNITDRLYSGDKRHRIEQEMVLGVGGSRALAAIGWDAPVRHLNEGHAGFMLLDLLDREIESGSTLANARATVRPRIVFTTHTPVPAGIDRFEPELAREYLETWADRWNVDVDDLLALGRDDGDDPPAFNMAALCLTSSERANGVSRLHGEVSRELFAEVPGGDAIGHITNGVHARTWVDAPLARIFDERLGDGWDAGNSAAWEKIDDIADDVIVTTRRAGAARLADLVAARCDQTLDPDALVIGFARRFATYKRATLLLSEADRLEALLADDARPVHFVFAGKAHPADDDGKRYLADVLEFTGTAAANGRFSFIPDYDIGVARTMYAGADVWLNTPIRPHEASGTSGEKSALNGGLNLSISDGWWAEMADDRNGWTIPSSTATVATQRDSEEAASTLDLLENAVVPTYFAAGNSWSGAWLGHMRDVWRSLGPLVTSGRMVGDYDRDLYQPALAQLEIG